MDGDYNQERCGRGPVDDGSMCTLLAGCACLASLTLYNADVGDALLIAVGRCCRLGARGREQRGEHLTSSAAPGCRSGSESRIVERSHSAAPALPRRALPRGD